jgi:hypothetical protein
MIGREAGNATLADTMARASIARQPFPDIGPRNNENIILFGADSRSKRAREFGVY